MALARVTTWSVGQVLTSTALNAEFDNILNNPASLINTMTGTAGDIWYASAANSWGRLAVGSADQFLRVSSGLLPSYVTLTASMISNLGSGVATFLATPSSANLAAAVTDETGSGALVLATSPTLVTPNIGAATASTITATSGIQAAGFTATGAGPTTLAWNITDTTSFITQQFQEAGTLRCGVLMPGSTFADATRRYWLEVRSDNATGGVSVWTNSVRRANFDLTGSFQLGGTAARSSTAGTNRVDIFDGTAPVGTLANGISLYSTSGELRVMDAAGNATLLSPHDREGAWVFDSRNAVTGRGLRIDVERLLRRLNALHGWDCIEEFEVP